MIYTFAGAVAEHLSYWAGGTHKTLSNPIITGFPLYGVGALIVYGIREGIKNLCPDLPIEIEMMLYGFSLVAFEALASEFVDAGHSIKCGDTEIVDSWDYSNSAYNIKGVVDLKHFIMFALLGFGVSRLNPLIISRLQKLKD
jgi:uncharacterized membrane protein